MPGTLVLTAIAAVAAVAAVAPDRPPATETGTAKQPVLTLDESRWVAFYDAPSRRFRDIRSAFVRGNHRAAARDLRAAASHLAIEAERALPDIAMRLSEVATRLGWIAEHTADESITLAALDNLFGRAHWLLAQHYLAMARNSRDGGHHRNAGLYLRATTHHLERAVLWSDYRIGKDVHTTLENLREMADALQDPARAEQAYREKPLVQADRLLRKLGDRIARPVLLPADR